MCMHVEKSLIRSWFPTSVYSTYLGQEERNLNLGKKALELKNTFQLASTDWRCATFNTLNLYNWAEEQDADVISLIDECRTNIHEFSKSYGVDEDISTLHCTDFWFNVAEPMQYQEYHQHTDSHFSLSYYVKTPENCGNLVFRSFESMFDMKALPIKNENLTQSSYKTCSYTPRETMLVVFRSNLLHMVEQNLSNEPRISISMNFSFVK
jgi:uncharacterized protein (TIGR02466 family)